MSQELLNPVGLRVNYRNRAGMVGSGIIKSYSNGYYIIANNKGYEEAVSDNYLDYSLTNFSNKPKPLSYNDLDKHKKDMEDLEEAAFIASLKVFGVTIFAIIFMYFMYLLFFKPAFQA